MPNLKDKVAYVKNGYPSKAIKVVPQANSGFKGFALIE